MEYVICIIILVATIILSKLIFKINIKRIKALEVNQELTSITDNFPDNINVAEEMLGMLDNKNVKIEQAKDTKTSLYIAITNKIIIADMKDNYARLQTIAHECIHSCQDRILLLFNFIFSNINIAYFLSVIILGIFKVIEMNMVYIFILTLLLFVCFIVRSYLEIDAMIKAKYLAKDYIESKKIISKEDEEKLLSSYDNINRTGIPFVIDHLLTNAILKILIFVIIGMIGMI